MNTAAIITQILGVGAIQAVINAVRKFGLTGNLALLVSFIVVEAAVVAVYYLGAYPLFQYSGMALLGVLSSAGFWRFRVGEPTPLAPDDPTVSKS
jgi:hypothetical protein